MPNQNNNDDDKIIYAVYGTTCFHIGSLIWSCGMRLGYTKGQSTPTVIAALQEKTVQQLQIGNCVACARCKEGVYSWGWNGHGELGLGHTNDEPTPSVITALQGKAIQQLWTGLASVYALSEQGVVYSWGENDHGQLGLGHTNDEPTPTVIAALQEKTVQQLQIGSHVAYARCKEGVYSWGWNLNGQLGLGHTNDELTPTVIAALQEKTVQQLQIGSHVAYARCKEGVYSWGWNSHSELGLGHTNDEPTPTVIAALQEKTVQQLQIGSHVAYARCKEGVYSWGWNSHGELGLGHTNDEPTPTVIAALQEKTVQQLQIGNYAAYARCKEGVYSWGWNVEGQLGLGHTNNEPTPTPTVIAALQEKTVQQLQIGDCVAYARCKEGVYSWGRNNFGQLGLDHTNNEPTPSVITALQGKAIQQLWTGNDAVYVLCKEGVYSCGWNDHGQLGLGPNSDSVVTHPQEIKTFSPYFQDYQKMLIDCRAAYIMFLYGNGRRNIPFEIINIIVQFYHWDICSYLKQGNTQMTTPPSKSHSSSLFTYPTHTNTPHSKELNTNSQRNSR